jgi:hypothetical protein
VDSGCIDENNLAGWFANDALNAETSGLWLVGNGSDLLTNKPIQQSRLAGVRSPD